MPRRPALVRKSDLAPALEAAMSAGWDHVCVEWETPDGKRLQITAAKTVDGTASNSSAYDKWEAGRAP